MGDEHAVFWVLTLLPFGSVLRPRRQVRCLVLRQGHPFVALRDPSLARLGHVPSLQEVGSWYRQDTPSVPSRPCPSRQKDYLVSTKSLQSTDRVPVCRRGLKDLPFHPVLSLRISVVPFPPTVYPFTS